MRRALFLTCMIVPLFLFFSAVVIAQEQNSDRGTGERVVPELRAFRVNPHPPQIDGDLSDDIWKSPKAEFAGDFTQREPTEGIPASESTLVAVAYDDDALYVAFWCYDSEPDKITGQLVRRDRFAEGDKVTFRVDPYHDHQTGHAFEVSVAGVQRDCRYYDENNSDMSWDAIWESGVKQHPWGWSCEMKIPYHCLRFAEKDEHVWGIDFQRTVCHKNEYSRWAYTPLKDGGFVSNFGHLTGLTGIKPARHLEILPYVVSSIETEPKSIGNSDGKDYMGNAGFDLKYSLSSNMIVNATINPDFGQVELDSPVLNLSTYETYYDEKRPFFLEGSHLFSTDFMLFYSRRIGRSPYSGVNDPEGIYYSDYPNSTTILGATKISGKLGKGTSIAILNAVTQEEKAEYAAETNVVLDSNFIDDAWVYEMLSADTITREAVVEPLANYTVVRLKQDVFEKSSIGAMFTAVSQDQFHPALTGGVDWRLYSGNSVWLFDGQAIFSRVDNENTGYGLDFDISKISGKHFRGSVGGTIKSPELSINRLGYTSRNDTKNINSWVQYRTTDKWWIVSESYNNLNFSASWNYDGVNYGLNGDYNAYWEFTNYWTLGYGIQFQGERYSDDETRGNGLWVWPEYPTWSWWMQLGTDARKKVTFVLNPGGGLDRGGSWWANYIGVDLRPRSNMEFSFGVNYKRALNATRWVDEIDGRSMFADLDHHYLYVHASSGIVLKRDLSIQLSAVALLNGLDYERHRYYIGDNEYSDVMPEYADDYDYHRTDINSTLLIRWEYCPGSTLYLVWTRSRPEFDRNYKNVNLARDFRQLFKGNDYNVFLIKASYWLNV